MEQITVVQEDSTAQKTGKMNLVDKLASIPCMGLFLAWLSGICFATAGFTADLAGDTDAAFVTCFTAITQLVFFLPICLWMKQPILGIDGETFLLFQRSFIGFFCFYLMYAALHFLCLSDTSAITFSAPVYVSIFACIFLKEPCGVFQVVTVVGNLVGVFLISRPSFLFEASKNDGFTSQERMIGVFLSFLCSLCMAYYYIVSRKLVKTPTITVLTFFSIVGIFMGSITINLQTFVSKEVTILPKSGLEWMFVVINSLCVLVGEITVFLACKIEQASLVALVRTFDIVMAFIYQAIFLPEPLYWTSIFGAFIVCSGCITVAMKKYWQTMIIKKRFRKE